MNDPDDRESVERAQAGDGVSFNRLVLRHQDAVYTLCLRMTGNADDAADVTQEAFVSAYRHLSDFKGGVFRAWVLRIAANSCNDLHRARKRRPATSLSATGPEDEERPDHDPPDRAPGPEASALQSELAVAIQRCLQELPEDQRLAIILCDQYGYDYQTISELTDAELGTVKSRINRARRKMRDFLTELGELLPDAYRLPDSQH